MTLSVQKKETEILDETSKKSLLKIPYFVLTISLIVTISVTYFYYSSAKTIDAQRFESRTNKIKSEIENRVNIYIALLRAGRGFFYASEKVEREEFAKFVENLNLRNQYPGVLAIGFSKIFSPEEKDALVRQMKSDGFSDFTIKPDTPRDEYNLIIYIEPLNERNRVALGFDMSSEPTRKLAMDSARDRGLFATSGRVILVQEKVEEAQPGFLIYVPVYKNKEVPETIEERRNQIEGFIYSPFRANEFVKDVVREGGIDEVSFKIYDYELNENNLLATGNEELGINDSVLRGQNEVEFGSRKWVITYTPTKRFQSQSLVWWTPIIFFLGLAICIILFFLSLSQSRTNLNLIRTADDLAASGVIVQTLLESEKAARENAEQSGKVKDEFLATISHELRTPLNVIGGWVNILKLSGVEKETTEKAIETINKNLRMQANLVEQMLIFSDKEFLINSKNWQNISLADLITECFEQINQKINEKNLVLIKNLTQDETKIYGDKEKLRQAFIYLLDNSIKFTPSGGTISVDLSKLDKQISTKITDTGEGISKEMMPHIFEGFRQSDSSTIRKYSGLGLGLAVAKKIVEGHHGTIKVESEGLQKGAVFTVNLPLAK